MCAGSPRATLTLIPMDVAASALAAGDTVLSRYVLEDRVGGTTDTPVWRGTDSRLRRAVAIRVLRRDDPRAAAVRRQAQQAAAFTDRRAVPVLDVGVDSASGTLVIVTDWVRALGYGDYLAARGPELLSPQEAAAVTLEVARCLAAAHAQGLTHGCLEPNSVLVTDSGEIRVRGLGIAGALAADPSPAQPFALAAGADVHGVGAVLYLGLTGRWPDRPTDHVPAAARLASGVLPWPSRVVADVPPVLDEIAARTVDGCALPRGRAAYSDLPAVVEALAAATESRAPDPSVGPPGRRVWPRVVGFLLAVAGIVAIAALGISLASGPVTRAPGAAPLPTVSEPGAGVVSPPPDVGPSSSGPIPVVAVRDVDPYGSDRQENRSLSPLAVDGQPGTAWTTLRYTRSDMSGKPGVGLRLDLGAPRPVSQVKLVLVGNDSDVEILAGDRKRRAPKGYEVFARAQGAPSEITLRSVQPVTARYLVVWLTRLPASGSEYQGGVAEVTVLP